MASSKMEVFQTAVSMYEVGARDGEIAASCPGGNKECLGGLLAMASPTALHDEALIEATQKINRILREVKEHRKDRELMLVNVGGAALLIWTEAELPRGFARLESDEEVRRLLRVKPVEHMSHPMPSMPSSDRTDY